MLSSNDPYVGAILSIVLFPMLFQDAVMRFAFSGGEATWLLVAKRTFLLLPAGAFIVACWASVASILSIPIRNNRHEFVTALFVTWWDLGKSILSFWGGMFRFVFEFAVALLGIVRLLAMGTWSIVSDILLMPATILRHLAQSVVRSPVPWIAVSLTLTWCVVETTIFTYVMSPVVIDTFSNITGESLRESFIRAPLFLFLFFVVMGSYAVLSTFVDAIRSRKVESIIGIAVIEAVALSVEVVFLYREFVDSLVPWFAQYSPDFDLNIVSTLAISAFAWFGVRSLSWFLFASHGTPTIMAVIQGRGLDTGAGQAAPRIQMVQVSNAWWSRTRDEAAWISERGEQLLDRMLLPPLQLLAAAFNFCALCVLNKHLFSLPFESLESIRYSEKLIRDFKKRSGFQATGEPAPSRARKRAEQPRVSVRRPQTEFDESPAEAVVAPATDVFEDAPTR